MDYTRVEYWDVDSVPPGEYEIPSLEGSPTFGSAVSAGSAQTYASAISEEYAESIDITPSYQWPIIPILDQEDQRWLEAYTVFRASGMLPIAQFPQTTAIHLVQYLVAGARSSQMVRGLIHVAAKAHGVVATPDGLYDHRYLNADCSPFPILSSTTKWSLASLSAWLELTYGTPNVDLIVLTDDTLVPDSWELFAKQLHRLARDESEPQVGINAVSNPCRGNFIWRSPPSTQAVAAVASVFHQLALVRPILGNGCWYLLARKRREQIEPHWINIGLNAINQYYQRQQLLPPEMTPRKWAEVLSRLNLPVDIQINDW